MMLGILLGGLVAVAVVVIVHELFPMPELPEGQAPDASDPVPLTEFLKFPAAFTLGSLIGAAGVGRLARRSWQPVVVTIGAVMLVVAAFVMLQHPHPLWAWVAGVFAPIPAAWIGGLMTHNLAVR
jgi:hypothetical protein